MTRNELRKDYLLNRWVVIAAERGRRPTDFAKKEREQAKTAACPLCPGNEHMTPPAVLVYLKSSRGIRKAKDKDSFRHRNWLVRGIPNLYPAFSPPEDKSNQEQEGKVTNSRLAIGHHEVLIESPIHDAHPSDVEIKQLTLVISAYIDRLRGLSKKPYVQYVSIFRNYGLEAGASLSHAHSQLIATPLIPRIVKEEMDASKEFWQEKRKCVFCDIIETESNGPRSILENSKFAVFAPYASINPMEFWIFPRRHQASLLDTSESEVRAFAQTLKACLKALKTLVNDPPYNYGFHLTTDKAARDFYHWHLEVYPRLAVWAGFEKSTGIFINTMTPETAAESLRKMILS